MSTKRSSEGVLRTFEKGLLKVTISDVKGFAKTCAMNTSNKVVDDLIEYVPKKKIEIVVHDDMVDKIIRCDPIKSTYWQSGRWKNICGQC